MCSASVRVGNRRHNWLPNFPRVFLGFWAPSNNQKCLFDSPTGKSVHGDYAMKSKGKRCRIFSCVPIHGKVWVSFHLHTSSLTDTGDVNSEIRIEKDYLKHFENKCRMAVSRFILINKLYGFKHPIKVISGLNHPHSLYWGLRVLSTMVSSVVVKAETKY